MFFIKHGFKKCPSWPRKSPQTEKLFHQGVSMEPKLHHTYLNEALTLMGGSLFTNKDVPLWENWNFIKIMFLCKIWVQKGSLLTKKITSDWKTFSLVNSYGTLALPYKPNLSSNYHKRKPFFSSQRCTPLGKLKFFTIMFFIKDGLKKSLSWPRKWPQTEKHFHHVVSMEPKLHHTYLT